MIWKMKYLNEEGNPDLKVKTGVYHAPLGKEFRHDPHAF
jgi:hypothetical protein